MPFTIALSGLNAASSDLRVIGNNVANSSTTGYKSSRAEFADIFASSNLGVTANAIGNGVRVSSVTQQFSQGNISFTDNNLDLAISGQGFFRLNDNGTTAYTRAGAFGVDRDGFVVNSQNQKLTAFQADSNGNITGGLGDLQLSTGDLPPQASSSVSMSANLDSTQSAVTAPFNRTDPTTYNNSTSVTVYDSLGNPLLMTTYYQKQATPGNTWNQYAYLTEPDGTVDEMIPAGGASGDPVVMTFNNAGALSGVVPNTGSSTVADYSAVTLGTGAANLQVTNTLTNVTQFGSAFAVTALSQDGFSTGRLSGVDIGETGIVTARYTNGQSRTLAQVAMANFTNPTGLRQLGDTTWVEAFDSGAPLVSAPGSGSQGLLQSGALESSNVQITEQLVNMITAQRNFQANAQVISTADTITQTIINIR
ncbi:MAG TPA: flagellar hook protein FlgE [Gammaproteobacteria bacterium]|nr:flagellar hook protein FlgE [Gammaproteobacteria bacterium]